MTAVFCSIAAASPMVSIPPRPKPGGPAATAVTSDVATRISGTNRRSILRIDPPRCAPQQRDQQSIHDEERYAERDLRTERRGTQRRGRAIQLRAEDFHRRQ